MNESSLLERRVSAPVTPALPPAPPARRRRRRRRSVDENPLSELWLLPLVLALFCALLIALLFLFSPAPLTIDEGTIRMDHAMPVPARRSAAALPTASDEALLRHLNAVMSFIESQIHPETYLANSFSGDARLHNWSVVYDDAMRAMAHLATGNLGAARRTIDYFIDHPEIRKTGYVRRGGRLIPVGGWVINILDADETRYGGRGVEHVVHVGPNALLGLAAVHLYRRTGVPRYLTFARERWTLIKSLQNEDPADPNYGGVRMGPLGDPANPREFRLSFRADGPPYYAFYNGEHAADFLALTQRLQEIDPANAEAYDHAASLLSRWQRTIYDPAAHLFFLGTTEVRYFDENIGAWVDPGVIPMHPLDTSALMLITYGVDGMDAFESGAAEKVRAALETGFRVSVSIAGKNGQSRALDGYDFVNDADRRRLVLWKEEGNGGETKARRGVGRNPLLSDEWSTWIAFADLRLAADYQRHGRVDRAEEHLASYYWNAVEAGMASAIPQPLGQLAYPYAHPLPYSLNVPVGFGWNTPHVPYATIGGVARVLGLLRFDPFESDGGLYTLRLNLGRTDHGSAAGAAGPGVIYTEAELYVDEAWRDVENAQRTPAHAERHWQQALEITERMFSDHPDWRTVARSQNERAKKAKDPFPLMGLSDLTPRDIYPVFKSYWALYHVGTAQFIRVMAYSELAHIAKERGDTVSQKELQQRARDAADRIRNDYYYAQVYDKGGWMWQPVQSLREYVDFAY